jgi:hypothetical protein
MSEISPAGTLGRPRQRAWMMERCRTIGLLLAVFAASFLLPLLGGTGLRICPFYLVTDLPCPGCGMGRSFCALSWGHVELAFRHHLMGPVLYFGLLVLLALQVGELILGRRLEWPAGIKRLATPLYLLLLVVTMAAWVARLAGVWPLI